MSAPVDIFSRRPWKPARKPARGKRRTAPTQDDEFDRQLRCTIALMAERLPIEQVRLLYELARLLNKSQTEKSK